jgi:hypothetical protein
MNMDDKSGLERFRTKNLFLLMGTNPLPNYVAAKLLSKAEGRIYFVHTKETNNITDKLIELLDLNEKQFCKVPTEDTDAYNVFSQVFSYSNGKKDIGLNYTGGTKIMSVHAYRAIEKNCPDAVFSYLDARELSMRISKLNDPLLHPFPVNLLVTLPFSTLLRMHGYTLDEKKTPKKDPFHPEVARNLAEVPIENLRCWCNYNLRSGPGTEIKGKKKKSQRKELLEVKLPNDPCLAVISSARLGCNTLGELSEKWNMYIVELAEWLDGKWLEHYTLWSIRENASSCDISDVGLGIEPNEKIFEFDIIAMRGYQLFAISCTTESKKGLLKQKLFEAYIRARQMGGDEARVGLVCCASPDNPKSNPEKIEQELQVEWEAKDKIRVFGTDSLPILKEKLADWFKSSQNSNATVV